MDVESVMLISTVWWMQMRINNIKYLGNGCLNLTCLRPTEALKFAKFIAPVDFNLLRELFTLPADGMTKDEVTKRVDKIVAIVKSHKDIDTVWLRPIVVGTPLHGLVEDVLLCEGYKVVYQRNELVGFNAQGKPDYKQDGWWEVTYE